MATVLSCAMSLPAAFRRREILAFHRRDAQEIAEAVAESETDALLRKGLVWNGAPAHLQVRFRADCVEASMVIDGAGDAAGAERFEAMLDRMLGLAQDVDAFERQHRDHPQIGVLIVRQAGLRVPVATTPFEALTWAVTGQQISLGAAVSLRRKLILAAGVRNAGGLMCYPDAGRVAALSVDVLRQAGFSNAKANTLLTVARLAADGGLPLDAWLHAPPVDEIRRRLLEVRGVGPWTVDYTLLRGFGWMDGSLHGDAAVRRGLQALLGREDKIAENEARSWLAPFSPWRALLAAHLWAAGASAAP
ncbi:DNA-3-methyladenine glycosylase [Thauera sp. 2A1]|uniref:DNA-3-methyladenine glycosylase family protein n=1 Tax=Thauera sp. 2A1 TaxID=2570191 RepID=UPI001D172447|nr:base excision DNA repair protein [Thauera sp. 2A1]KAI5915178.1 base excision DNA repair protein [Thauera sp. 2A1]